MVCPVRPRTQSNDGRCGLLPWPERRPAHIQHQHSLYEWFACRPARPRPCAPRAQLANPHSVCLSGPREARAGAPKQIAAGRTVHPVVSRRATSAERGPDPAENEGEGGIKNRQPGEALRDSTASSHARARPSVPRSRSPPPPPRVRAHESPAQFARTDPATPQAEPFTPASTVWQARSTQDALMGRVSALPPPSPVASQMDCVGSRGARRAICICSTARPPNRAQHSTDPSTALKAHDALADRPLTAAAFGFADVE